MKKLRQILAYLFLMALIAVPVLLYFNAQALSDWWALRGYTPPPAIAKLASQDTMSPYTRRLFYINHPQLISSVSGFRQDCPEDEQTIVLGCYHPGDRGIYIYAVQDPQLYGIQQVTAAHEVLHAVYARLSSKDKAVLDSELESYYQHGLTDSRVLAEVKLYQQTEPTAVMDEMSCTFGTEIAKLPPGLEAYYAKYFSNRQTIVSYEQRYQSEFTSRENQIKTLSGQLSGLKQTINDEEQSLGSQLDQINSDRARLNALQASKNYSSYNASVSGFNQEVDSYNSGVSKLKSDIEDYNMLVGQYNSLAGELAQLQKDIDTRLTVQQPK